MGGHAAAPAGQGAGGSGALPPAAAAGKRRHRERVPLPDKEPCGGVAAVLLCDEGGGPRGTCDKEEAAEGGDGEGDSCHA